jgi:hypothetical protein
MRRKWEKGDFVYFSSHNFLLELSALRGQKKPQVFELGPPSRKRQCPEWLWGITTEHTGHAEKKREEAE